MVLVLVAVKLTSKQAAEEAERESEKQREREKSPECAQRALVSSDKLLGFKESRSSAVVAAFSDVALLVSLFTSKDSMSQTLFRAKPCWGSWLSGGCLIGQGWDGVIHCK